MTTITVSHRYTGRTTRCELVRRTKTTLVLSPLEGLFAGKQRKLTLRYKGSQFEHFADDFTGYQVFTSHLEASA